MIKSKILLTPANCDDEYFDDVGMVYIILDKSYLETLLKMKKVALKMNHDQEGFYKYTLWMDGINFSDHDLATYLVDNEIEEQSSEYCLIPAATHFDALETYTKNTSECEQLEVTVTGVRWTAFVRHTDNIKVETPEIAWDILEKFLESFTPPSVTFIKKAKR